MRAEINDTFVSILTMDDLEARKIATDPKLAADWVLKPNREGGGHNVHGADIPVLLASTPEALWPNYVLMRAICPPEDVHGTLMTPEGLYSGPVISELGVLGGCVWRCGHEGPPQVLKNDAIGWTFKSKPKAINEMSVVKGFGCFDSTILTM
nr:glutathione synthetase [Quercus suber]